jgi:uncharacterized membrane protein
MTASRKEKIIQSIVHGAIAILPIGVVFFILIKLFVILRKILVPIDEYLGLNYVIGAVLVLVILVFSILLACYMLGRIFQTRLGNKLVESIDNRAKEAIPGYEIVSNVLKSHTADNKAYPPALISLFGPGTDTLGFIMEDNGGDYLTVFIPSVPVVTVGAIHSVERSRVKLIKGTQMDAANCITKWGLGLSELRGG